MDRSYTCRIYPNILEIYRKIRRRIEILPEISAYIYIYIYIDIERSRPYTENRGQYAEITSKIIFLQCDYARSALISESDGGW